MIGRGGIVAIAAVAGALAAGCSSSSNVDRRDGAAADAREGGGQIACGSSVCGPSEVCVVPPCDCVSLADPSCPAPSCVSPAQDAAVSCTPLDGGLSGTVTAAPTSGSRYCYHVCF